MSVVTVKDQSTIIVRDNAVFGAQGHQGVVGAQGAQGNTGPAGAVVFEGGVANTDFSVGISLNCGGVT